MLCMWTFMALDTNVRVPGYKDSNVKLLPSSTTKHAIWELYLQDAATSSMRAVAFTDLWCQLLPNIVVMKPMSEFVNKIVLPSHPLPTDLRKRSQQ